MFCFVKSQEWGYVFLCNKPLQGMALPECPLSACLLACLLACLFACLLVCLLAWLFVCFFVCLFICLFIWIYIEIVLMDYITFTFVFKRIHNIGSLTAILDSTVHTGTHELWVFYVLHVNFLWSCRHWTCSPRRTDKAYTSDCLFLSSLKSSNSCSRWRHIITCPFRCICASVLAEKTSCGILFDKGNCFLSLTD